MEPSLSSLLQAAYKPASSEADKELIERAYNFAKHAHASQKRKSGEPYFVHLHATAVTVARWGLDATTIAAALLHDTVEDTATTLEQLEKEFGKEIAFLVNGVTKISRLKYRGNEAQVETMKKMVLALSEDVRVIFIKLADRMHNMQTLAHLPAEKQKRIALETSDIYAPLAYRMGLAVVSGDLEDLAFSYLNPEAYKELKKTMETMLKEGEKHIAKAKERVEEELRAQHIPFIRIDSRVKRISSLYKKLKRHDMNMERVHDLLALRIIVEKPEECYAALGAIHSVWPPLPGHIKDYIALPKPNGYRSLHTTVIAYGGRPTEFQIRTAEMHHENEYGIAAYWAYNEAKDDSQKHTVFANARQLAWINQLKAWQETIDDPDEFLASLKIDFFKHRIFVITPKGEAVDLPAGATPVDFAYAIHSEVGDHCIGAKVNGRMVQLDDPLQSGDVVEILTQKSKRPTLSWLNFVKTRHARSHIRSAQRELESGKAKSLQFKITALDRLGLLNDITAVFAKAKVNIVSHESHRPRAGAIITIKVVAGADANAKLDLLLIQLRAVHNLQRIEFKRV